jgi:excisionase family DNA binding protein
MTDMYLSDPGYVRRRKLDELFADQPYLSATMKASRLHERQVDTLPPVTIPIVGAAADEDGLLQRLKEARSARLLADTQLLPSAEWKPPQREAKQSALSNESIQTPLQCVEKRAPASSAAPDSERLVKLNLLVDLNTRSARAYTAAGFVRPWPEVMFLNEAAAFLRVSPRMLRRWARDGRVPSSRLDRRLRFRRAALEAWLRENE